MQYGVFFFFAGCVLINTLFAYTCLPETKGVPVEKVEQAWEGYVLPLDIQLQGSVQVFSGLQCCTTCMNAVLMPLRIAIRL